MTNVDSVIVLKEGMQRRLTALGLLAAGLAMVAFAVFVPDPDATSRLRGLLGLLGLFVGLVGVTETATGFRFTIRASAEGIEASSPFRLSPTALAWPDIQRVRVVERPSLPVRVVFEGGGKKVSAGPSLSDWHSLVDLALAHLAPEVATPLRPFRKWAVLEGEAPPRRQEASSWRDLVWPETGSLERAAALATQGAFIAGLYGSLSLVEGYLNRGAFGLVDGILYLLAAAGLWYRMRSAAIAGLMLFLVNLAYLGRDALSVPLLNLVVLASLVHSVRATYAWHTLNKTAPWPIGKTFLLCAALAYTVIALGLAALFAQAGSLGELLVSHPRDTALEAAGLLASLGVIGRVGPDLLRTKRARAVPVTSTPDSDTA